VERYSQEHLNHAETTGVPGICLGGSVITPEARERGRGSRRGGSESVPPN